MDARRGALRLDPPLLVDMMGAVHSDGKRSSATFYTYFDTKRPMTSWTAN